MATIDKIFLAELFFGFAFIVFYELWKGDRDGFD